MDRFKPIFYSIWLKFQKPVFDYFESDAWMWFLSKFCLLIHHNAVKYFWKHGISFPAADLFLFAGRAFYRQIKLFSLHIASDSFMITCTMDKQPEGHLKHFTDFWNIFPASFHTCCCRKGESTLAWNLQAEGRSLRSMWTSKRPDEHHGRPMWRNQREKIRIWLVGHRSGSNQWSQSAFGNISQMAADRGGGTNTWLRLLLQSLLRESRQCRQCLLRQIAWKEVCLNKDACKSI